MALTRRQIVSQLIPILRANSPVRGEFVPPGRKMPKGYTRPTRLSPHPGNLRLNAFKLVESQGQATVKIGDGVPYALRTETTSFRKGWIAKSRDEFLARLIAYGGRLK